LGPTFPQKDQTKNAGLKNKELTLPVFIFQSGISLGPGDDWR
jgi:hypothetical protein